MPWSQQSSLTKGMPIKVQEATFRLYKNLSPKLHDYNTRTRSWLRALAAITNQPFGMHFEHVHTPASSPCLPPILGPRFFLAPMWDDFDLSLRKEIPFVHATWQLLLYIPNVHDAIFWKLLAFISFATWCGTFVWYICVIPCPTKRKVMSSSHPMFILLLCRSIMEFF